MIETVSTKGGHLASNLGVVELTVALHKNFDCPNDKIIRSIEPELIKETEEYKKNMDPRQFNYIRSDIVITKLFNFLKENNEMYLED